MTVIEQLKAEIEKRLKNTRDYMNGAGMKYKGPKYHASRGRESAYDAILSFLSTLESEKSVPADLEEVADEFANQDCVTFISRKNGFVAGAKWQEERDQETIELAEDHAFLAGSEWQKEQMMREAVEGEVCIPNVWVEHKEGKELVVRAEISKELGFKFGDKVRIIIVKR